MQGDKLASGARSATFSVAPGLRFDEGQMHDDLHVLDAEHFMLKYLCTQREYDRLLRLGDDEAVSTFAIELQQRAEAASRAAAADTIQEASLKRTCFLKPFVAFGLVGKIIISRDTPLINRQKSDLLLPISMRKQKDLLPTTGHILTAAIYDVEGKDVSREYIGRRILFGAMSGTPISFKGYPTWIALDLAEIIATIPVEDAELIEENLEPMV